MLYMENVCIRNTFMTKTLYPALKGEADSTLQKLVGETEETLISFGVLQIKK